MTFKIKNILKFSIICISFFCLSLFIKANILHAETFVFEDLTEDTVWTLENSPYILENPILLGDGVRLDIEGGVVVKFMNGASMGVQGEININGIEGQNVVFTSFLDDAYGIYENDVMEELEEDMNASAGDWDGLYFLSNSIGVSNIDLIFRYGNIFYAQKSNIDFKNIYFENQTDGMYIIESEANFSDIKFTDVEYLPLVIENKSTFYANNVDINGAQYPISIYRDSLVNILNIDIVDSKNTPISIFNNSKLDSENINIKNSENQGLEIFNSSEVYVDNISIQNVESNASLIIFNNSEISANNVDISYGEYGVMFFNGAKLNLSNGVISNFTYSGFEHYGSSEEYGENNLNLNFIDVKQNSLGVGDYLPGGNYVCNKCSIYENENGIQSSVDKNFDFTNVWWGSEDGPYNQNLNPEGRGNSVSDNILFDPFLKSKPSKNTPLIIIPGITGSYLYKDYDDKGEIWLNLYKMILPFGDQYLNDLVLNENGKQNEEFPITVGDIIRSVEIEIFGQKTSVDIFNLFIDYFIKNGYEENKDLFVFPYDWRFSNVDTAQYLNQKINEILENTGSEKVDVVVHSMGGIVAKTYIKNFGEEKIDNLVFMGTPHLGAPKGAKALLYGDDMGINKFNGKIHILDPDRLKFISQNMPSGYELLPSRRYIDENGPYLKILNFKTGNENFLNFIESTNFLFSSGLNQALYTSADILHKEIDVLDFGNINVSNISACGTGTLGQIEILEEMNLLDRILKKDFKLHITNGDGTVPIVSANGVNTENKYFIDKISHGTMPSSGGVPELVYKIIKDENTKAFSNSEDICTKIEGDVLSKHSPIDLHIYDEEGNHAGPDEDGNIENNIDGVVYEILEDKAFVFLPKGREYKIKGSATGNGDFDLAIENINGDILNATKYWQGIDINENSQIDFSVNSGNYSEVSFDIDGDDVFEGILSEYVSLGENENYLDYSYQKFVDENSENTNQISGSLKKDILEDPNSINEIYVNDEHVSDKDFVKHESLVLNEDIILKKEDIDTLYSDIQKDQIENINSNLLASAKDSNILINTAKIIFVFSVLLFVYVTVKKYYFKIK